MALGAAAKAPSWTLQAVCRYCVRRMVASSAPAGDVTSRHPIATAVVHVRMVRIAPDARTCAVAHKVSHLHARVNRCEGVVPGTIGGKEAVDLGVRHQPGQSGEAAL